MLCLQGTQMETTISTEYLYSIALQNKGNLAQVAKEVGLTRGAVFHRLKRAKLLGKLRKVVELKEEGQELEKEQITQKETDEGICLTYIGAKIETVEDLIKETKIDLDIFEIERVVINNWETAGKVQNTNKIYKTGLRQIKAFLRRKKSNQVAIEQLLKKIENNSFSTLKLIKRPKLKSGIKRALELAIMDPHYGLLCYEGESNNSWSLEECEQLCLWSVNELIARAAVHGEFEEIIFPFGNDFMHHDNMLHSTTKGTLQPEAVSYAHVLERAITLAITLVEKMREIAPVRIIQVSGNHDYVSSFSLGHILKAYFRRNTDVTVDVSPSPYKFYHFGTNLIGFDHGHHINPIRLAAIMAHECKAAWATTTYREWHLGDQHRKGSSKPHTFEEQGVSIEYLMALTPANAWHKQKGFNWQQRGATGFVWDYHEGPIARVQVNLDSYTGKPTGK